MSTPDPAGELLAAMFTAWRDAIDSEPFRDFEPDVVGGEHSAAHHLINS